jgi:2-keto-3-deoxy-L-rhamnonate aldolase RhmA
MAVPRNRLEHALAERRLRMGFTFVAAGSDLSLLARNAAALAGRFRPDARPGGATPQ